MTNKDKLKIRVNLQSSLAPSSSTVFLQIYNHNTHSWETKASDNESDADTDFNLTDEINTYQEYYYDSDRVVAIRVYQQNSSGSSKSLSVDQVKMFFITAYQDEYSDQPNTYRAKYHDSGNKYEGKYSGVGNDYKEKYTSTHEDG